MSEKGKRKNTWRINTPSLIPFPTIPSPDPLSTTPLCHLCQRQQLVIHKESDCAKQVDTEDIVMRVHMHISTIRLHCYPAQVVPGEAHVTNTPWPPRIHLWHWWKTNMQPTICRWHRSCGRHPWWTWRLHQQIRRQSNSIIMEWKSAQKRARSSSSSSSSLSIP